MPSDTDDTEHTDPVGSTVADETTRVEAISYLEGATGHGVFSLVLVISATVLLTRERVGVAVVVGLIALGVSLHGLSIYTWDELRRVFLARFERNADGTDRSLTPHTVSAEMKAEMVVGAVMVGGLSISLGLLLWLSRSLPLKWFLIISFMSLAGANLAGIAWSYIRS